MTSIRTVLLGVLLVAAVSSCGGQPAGGAVSNPTGAPAAVAAPAPAAAPEAAVETVFRRYYEALLARDFTTACQLNAAETKAAMLKNLQKQGGIKAASCEEAFQKIYAKPAAAKVADRIATTAHVDEVTVTGDQATISWTAEVQGKPQSVTNEMRLVDGEWQLLDTNS